MPLRRKLIPTLGAAIAQPGQARSLRVEPGETCAGEGIVAGGPREPEKGCPSGVHGAPRVKRPSPEPHSPRLQTHQVPALGLDQGSPSDRRPHRVPRGAEPASPRRSSGIYWVGGANAGLRGARGAALCPRLRWWLPPGPCPCFGLGRLGCGRPGSWARARGRVPPPSPPSQLPPAAETPGWRGHGRLPVPRPTLKRQRDQGWQGWSYLARGEWRDRSYPEPPLELSGTCGHPAPTTRLGQTWEWGRAESHHRLIGGGYGVLSPGFLTPILQEGKLRPKEGTCLACLPHTP